MAKEKKIVDPTLAGFYEVMEEPNMEKIANEMLASISENSSDSESFDVECGNEDAKDWPWISSHVVFGKSAIKQGQIEAMRGRYFRDISIVRAGGENNVPLPEADEVVVFRSFMKARLRFPLDKMLVEVLKTFEIYLRQLTPEAIIKVGVFIWAMRSQGLEPDARCFCNIHELSYQTKATGKEQYHNNFGCYSFVPRAEASYHVPTFRKKWQGSWMQEWFYVKVDLSEREDITGVIQRPIWSRFGIRRPVIALGNDVQACQAAFNTVCTYIGTRYLVQEHIAYGVWPLSSRWEMPKETAAGSNQNGLAYLKYTFRYMSQFDEPNDDWIGAIEATSDELLGAYSKAEDEAMTTAFGARGKKRLNMVFDVIGFVYPDYCYPSRKQGKKRKSATSATSSASRSKKVKVLTRRPSRIETTDMSNLIEGAAPISEPSRSMPVEARTNVTEEPEVEKTVEHLKALSPPCAAELLKPSNIPTTTPRKRRMFSVLDAVIESMKTSTPASTEVPRTKAKVSKKSDEAGMTQTISEAGPSEVPVEARPSESALIILEKEGASEKSKSPAPEAPAKELEFIVRHASGKQLSEEQVAEVQHYAKDLKYPRGSLMYGGVDADDFLYCLPDNKEMNVCWTI
jgi:hypothetical protein